MKREIHVFSIPKEPIIDGGVIASFEQLLQKDSGILGVNMLSDNWPVVVCSINPEQIHYELHSFFVVVLGNVVNLCVDDTYCGIVKIGDKWCAVFHQPTRTRTAKAPMEE